MIEVNGDGAAPLYQWLKAEQPGDGDSAEITWNFEKFLVDKQGNVVRRFPPITTPEDVANVIYLLSLPEAAWINGAIIRVDGGEHISGLTR